MSGGRRPRPRRQSLGAAGPAWRREPKPNDEARPLVRAPLRDNVAAHGSGKIARNRQPQPRSAKPARDGLVELEEGIKKAFGDSVGKPNARITHFKQRVS